MGSYAFTKNIEKIDYVKEFYVEEIDIFQGTDHRQHTEEAG